MGFVDNYALGGLSPQIYDIPVIHRKRAHPKDEPLIFAEFNDYFLK
jgi:hypothetical protein